MSETPATPTPKSLIAKLAEACDSVGGVEKLGKNEQQGYKYVKAADVAKAIRHELFSRGIVILPVESEPTWREYLTKSGNMMRECTLPVDYLITDGVESLTFRAYGIANDSGDKAIYKAKTGALKYFLRGLGLIPDEKDDPEFDEEGKPIEKRTSEGQKDFAEEKIKRLKAEKKAEPHLNPDEPTGNRISEPQRKRLFAISREKNWPEAALRDLLGSYGFEHSNEITRDKYEEICKVVEATA